MIIDPPVIMTIAGSDSGGGAGIQADLKTMHALGCYGTSAITAVTCQNTTGVSAVQAIEPEIVAGQIRDVLEDFPVKAAKTGMLFSTEIIHAVRDAWSRYASDTIFLVVDPVMVATSGARLLQEEAREALLEFLPRASLVTPNLPEAELILGRSISGSDDMQLAAREIQEKLGTAVLLKGGHLKDAPDRVLDIYYDGRVLEQFQSERFHHGNTHGTGCTLSAAIAAYLGRGKTMIEAVQYAREYLRGALAHAPNLGAGHGPMNHLWTMSVQ